MTEEQPKKKKEESPELKEELTEDELKGMSGGHKHVLPLPGMEENGPCVFTKD